MNVKTFVRALVCTQTQIYTCTWTHTHIYSIIHTNYTHKHTQNIHIHTHTQTHTHKLAHMHTHTQTHKHKQFNNNTPASMCDLTNSGNLIFKKFDAVWTHKQHWLSYMYNHYIPWYFKSGSMDCMSPTANTTCVFTTQ